MGDDSGAVLDENGVSGDVVKMIVSVDDKLDRKLGEHTDFAKKGLGGSDVFESVHDQDRFVADNEAGIGACFAFGVVNGGINAVAERLEGKRQRSGG